MKKRVRVEAMGKNIIIDNPDNINITFRGGKNHSFGFKLKINERDMKRLQKQFKRMGE